MKKRVLSTLVTLVMIMMSFMSVTAMAGGPDPWDRPTEYLYAQYIDADGKIQTASDVIVVDERGEYSAEKWYILPAGKHTIENLCFNVYGLNLILENGADVTVEGGICLRNNYALTIYAQPTKEGEVAGKLTVNSEKRSTTGIGPEQNGRGSDITINGGTIIAYGDNYGAAIGSGNEGRCGNITINGGTIIAYGGNYGAAIGSGNEGRCGNITINGGTVTAKGSEYGAGIGGGFLGSCGKITINSGTITASSGMLPAVGVGPKGSCGGIAINGRPQLKAGRDAATAQKVSKYQGERYLHVRYSPGGVPRTGDTANTTLWIILLLASSSGVAACQVISKRKRNM